MKIQKAISSLKSIFDGEEQSPENRCERISSLLEKLEKKQTKLQNKLETEEHHHKRKTLKAKIKVIRLQIKKGEALKQQLGETTDQQD